MVIRHAKSSWKYNVKDHDRPLKNRGKNDAENISKHTSSLFDNPDLVICSTANRTKLTAKHFVNNWGIDESRVEYNSSLYDFSGSSLIEQIKSCKDSVNSLMIFGHNFAITDFVNTFGNLYIENVPTCGFVVIDFDIESWSNLKKGTTVYKVFPKEIR